MNATQKQISYIISLYNELHGTTHGYLSQCNELKLTMRERSGQVSKPAASGYIDDLKKRVETKRRAAQ